jgi:hypothetical protein
MSANRLAAEGGRQMTTQPAKGIAAAAHGSVMGWLLDSDPSIR